MEDQPHVITWEVTRACALHCRHCRASAIPRRDPEELPLDRIVNTLEDIATAFRAPPILVFTGGDPTERPDLLEILAASVVRRLPTAVAPSVTARLNPADLRVWHTIGVGTVSLSLDGPNPDVHDRYRGVAGTFDRTLAIAEAVHQTGMRLQINTAVAPETIASLPVMSELVTELGVASWELFFVIPTGRARRRPSLDADAIERTLQWVAEYDRGVDFRVTAVGAPQFVRVRHELQPDKPFAPGLREARGFAFIDHKGHVFPSGYLPLIAGNVLDEAFSHIYRHSTWFQWLRDPGALKGGCARCAYSAVCGGSRARAYAVTGDALASDPGCPLSQSSPV